jgi:large exoprotein involved in heme utilization and adhesion
MIACRICIAPFVFKGEGRLRLEFAHQWSAIVWIKERARALALVSALLGAASVAVAPAFAGPTGGTVVSGQAIIQSLQQETLIKQGTSKAIINWNAFSILANESVVFQ